MIRVVRAKACPICGRRDWHIHPNSEWDKAKERAMRQLKLW